MYFLVFTYKSLHEWNFWAAHIQMIVFVRKCQLVCWNGFSSLHSHQEYMTVPLIHNGTMLGVTRYLSFVSLVNIKWYLTVILICIPLTSKGRAL